MTALRLDAVAVETAADGVATAAGAYGYYGVATAAAKRVTARGPQLQPFSVRVGVLVDGTQRPYSRFVLEIDSLCSIVNNWEEVARRYDEGLPSAP